MNPISDNSPPQMCGYYSIKTDGTFDSTASSLRYFKTTNLPINLNIGFENFIKRPDSYVGEALSKLLMFILENKNVLSNETQFITIRGVIRQILMTPYKPKDGWSVLACKYKNNIYICNYKKPEEIEKINNLPMREKLFAFYGPKFEQCCLTDHPSKFPNTLEQVDERPQLFRVLKKRIVGRNFLFAAETDGVISDVPIDSNNHKSYKNLKFIELKVGAQRKASVYSDKCFKRYKCMQTWIQCYLSGVNDIYYGWRTNDGILEEIEHFDNDSLLNYGEGFWEPHPCFLFLMNFLKIVENEMENVDCSKTVYEFSFNENTSQVDCSRHTSHTLLPDWYLEALN